MKRLLFVMVLAAGCNKPDAGDCRKAIERINVLTKTDNIKDPQSVEAAVRSCRGNATKERVRCAIEAEDLDALYEKCHMLTEDAYKAAKEEETEDVQKRGSGSGSGSASGSGK